MRRALRGPATLLLGALTAVVLAACGNTSAQHPGADPGLDPDSLSAPPPIRLVLADDEVELFQGSYCWDSAEVSVCSDGMGPTEADLVDAGGTSSVEVVVDVPLDSLEVELSPLPGGRCAPSYDAEAVALGEGHYRIDPAGPGGRYQVSLWGRAPQGEVPGYFQWRMPAGPAPEPQARLSIVWEPHGELEGQGFLFRVEGLPPQAYDATASVTATASNGESMTFDAGEPDDTCPRGGTLAFAERGTDVSDQVALLGPAPFDYAVDLTLDGEVFHGSGRYPEEVDSDPGDDNPAPVLLTWDPPLPTDSD